MTDTYLIKLRPLTHYYFGGEQGLGSGDSRNYLVKSRLWPQQTTLLGLVRYVILREQGLLAQNWEESPQRSRKIHWPQKL